MPDAPIPLPELRQQVEKLAQKAGEIALRYRTQSLNTTYKTSTTQSPVTAADLEIDRFLKEKLTALCPHYGWLSEETVNDNQWHKKDRAWVVDPIDGTTGFIKSCALPNTTDFDLFCPTHFSISIALCARDGTPLLGVVYAPLIHRIMSATLGDGLYLNGQKLPPITAPKTLENCTFLASTSEAKANLLSCIPKNMPQKTVGSSAYKLALTATHPNLVTASVKPKSYWDVAAAMCLLNEAKIPLTDLNRTPLIFTQKNITCNGLITAPKSVFSNLAQHLPCTVLATYT